MGDPYWRYGGGGNGHPPSSERGHTPKATFPGYLSSETPNMANYNSYNSMDPRTTSSDFLYKDTLPSHAGAYGIDGMPSVRAEPSVSGLVAGASYKGYPSSQLDHHRDGALGRTPGIPDLGYDRPNSMTRNDGNPAPDLLHKDTLPSHAGAYGIDGMPSVRAEPSVSGLVAGASYKGYPSSQLDHHRDGALGRTPGIPDLGYDRPNSMTRNDGNPAPDLLHKDILPSRSGVYDMPSVHAEPSVSGLVAGASYKDYPSSFEDPNLVVQHRDVVPGRTPGIPDVGYDRPISITRADGNPAPVAESNILFVDGLPTDCTRREVGHLFRPFIGFREIRLIHKERRRRGDKAMVLCFIEFTDTKCARTAMEALQGYKFDDKKPNCILRINFAHFPFRLPSDRADPDPGGPR